MKRKMRTRMEVINCLMVIWWSVSYVLGVKRASGRNFIGAANDRARILKDSEFELAGFEAQQVFVELYFSRASQLLRQRREVDARGLGRRDLDRVASAKHRCSFNGTRQRFVNRESTRHTVR